MIIAGQKIVQLDSDENWKLVKCNFCVVFLSFPVVGCTGRDL